MTDKYTQFVSRGLGKDIAKKLGLPQPAVLRRHPGARENLDAIILVLDEAARPEDLEKPVLSAAGSLRDLAANARVVTVSRDAAEAADPAAAAARQGIDGLLRSLAKELRAGATCNGIVLADGTRTT